MCDHLSPTVWWWWRRAGGNTYVDFFRFFTTSDPRLQRCCSSCAFSGHAFDGPWPSLRKKRVCCALLWWNMVESFPTILSFGTGVFSLRLPISVCVCSNDYSNVLPWLLACASVACCLHVVCVCALGELFLCLNGWSQLCGMFVTRKQQNQPHGLMNLTQPDLTEEETREYWTHVCFDYE